MTSAGAAGVRVPPSQGVCSSGLFLARGLAGASMPTLDKPREEQAIGNHYSDPGNQLSPLQPYVEE